MRVRATMLGFYNYQRRRVGTVFDLTDPKHFCAKWMEQVGKSEPVEPKTAEFDRKVEIAKAEHAAAKAAVEPPKPLMYPDSATRPKSKGKKASSNDDVI